MRLLRSLGLGLTLFGASMAHAQDEVEPIQAVTAANTPVSGPGDYLVGFGPFVGGGKISTDADVRHVSGYALSVERRWRIGASRVTMGPRFELSNAFVSTRATSGATKVVGTYDNRIFAGGVTIAADVGNLGTLVQSLYLTGLAGRGYTKLTLDESTERQTFTQALYGNISGNWWGGELGAWIPLKGAFGVNVAMLGNAYRLDQSSACGTFEGNRVDETGALALNNGSYACGAAQGIDQIAMLRTVSAKVGLSLGF